MWPTSTKELLKTSKLVLELAKQVRILVLAEDPDLVLSTHTVGHKHLYAGSGVSDTLF